MTKTYWNSVVKNINKISVIYTKGRAFHPDGSCKEIEDKFNITVNEAEETMTISFVHPHCVDAAEFLATRTKKYVDIPETVTYHRTEIVRVQFGV